MKCVLIAFTGVNGLNSDYSVFGNVFTLRIATERLKYIILEKMKFQLNRIS